MNYGDIIAAVMKLTIGPIEFEAGRDRMVSIYSITDDRGRPVFCCGSKILNGIMVNDPENDPRLLGSRLKWVSGNDFVARSLLP